MREDVVALYVDPRGPYPKLVREWYDEARDARTYAGPWPVVAHPPCERWGRYWGGGPMLHGTPNQKLLGDDDGRFEHALSMVRRFGGVLEHPEATHAFRAFGLTRPPKSGGWVSAEGGWTCCVEQGHYGHQARKATWLYVASSTRPPDLIWGSSGPKDRLDAGYHSARERKSMGGEAGLVSRGIRRQPKSERHLSPIAFAEWLIEVASRCRV